MTVKNEAILKAVSTAGFGSAPNYVARLNPTQGSEFIRTIVDNTPILKLIRTIDMPAPTYDLDFVGVASRIIRKATEGTAPTVGNNFTFTKKSLNTVEIVLPEDITQTFLEDNIERAGAEDTISSMLATQFGNDLADLFINGDTADAGASKDFLNIDDGLVKLAKVSRGTHKFDTNASQDFKGVVFPGMMAQLPNKWKAQKANLRFLVSPSVADAYIDQLATRQTALGDELIQGGRLPEYKGVKILPVEYMPDDVLILTPLSNLAMGIQRDFTIAREYVPRKRIYEYTITSRVDACQIVIDDALVIAYNIT